MINCERCGCEVPSLSPMRKWCYDCRKRIGIEQARDRKIRKRAQLQVIPTIQR